MRTLTPNDRKEVYTMKHIPSYEEALALFKKLDHASREKILEDMRKCLEKYETAELLRSQAQRKA